MTYVLSNSSSLSPLSNKQIVLQFQFGLKSYDLFTEHYPTEIKNHCSANSSGI